MSFPAPPYRAPGWLPGGHAQTIWPLLIKGPLPRYRRERWDTPDGDFVDVDFLDEGVAAATDSATARRYWQAAHDVSERISATYFTHSGAAETSVVA